MVTVTIDDVKRIKGVDLIAKFKDSGEDPAYYVQCRLNDYTKTIYREVNKHSTRAIPSDEYLTENQVEAIKDAVANLCIYYLSFGDTKALGNIDYNGNHIATVPDGILEDLRVCGLIVKRFGRRLCRW